MWRQKPTLDKWGNQIFDSQEKFAVSETKSCSIDYTSLNALTLDIWNAISSSKLKYDKRLVNKLNDSKTAQKTYWAILETFVNGSKISLMPPLLVDKKRGTDFLDNANLFNNVFAKQFTPISNDSIVPVSINFETREKLSSLEFCVDDIVKIMRLLDQNKAYVHEEISIRMIKLCTSSISKPLHLIFRSCPKTESFHQRMEKSKYNFCR